MSRAEQRMAQIERCLREVFAPQQLRVIDDGHKHHGHAAAQGGGHFSVEIVATVFEGKSLIQRHRLIYDSLAELMTTEIHALSIKAYAVDEVPDL